ncbi:serpin family protein [Anaerocolumna sp.]|uniref:serpin family protein n=1 Tax=Anaerocolumna sp. TaxID=2041569 RepID=UPI0028B1070F|nr:serpin family protein [Anaerocolumna sp.]
MKKIALLLALMLTLTACNSSTNLIATNLMAGVNKNDIAPIVVDKLQENSADKTTEIVDFSLDIFEKIHEDENTLISPLSIISALSMTANGAEKETLAQMEEAFGTDIGSLNEYLYAYKSYLPTADKYKVSLANSIWFKDKENLIVEKEFLQTNKNYYDAEIYKAPFDDSTKNDINAWVNEKTDGQIKKLLEEKPPENAVMYLINALSFDAEWLSIYKDSSISDGEFTAKSGDKKMVDFMHSTEYGYIEVPNAIGFSKPYADNKYSFVALLPDGGLAISDFMASIDGKTLIDAIKKQSNEEVNTFMPKFAFEYNKELSEILKKLGIRDAFDGDIADFSSLGQSSAGNIFISRVIHKTKIEVDEKGTKAGAVTAVEMKTESARLTEPKMVNLNRPFFFMIVDNEFNMPIFMGVLNDVK